MKRRPLWESATPTKVSHPKEKIREEYYEPRQHYDQNYENDKEGSRAVNCYVGKDWLHDQPGQPARPLIAGSGLPFSYP
ncbi:unnamed protein product [Microthlaspi erraticum]|uniref:Uncharacterized protein n=1 Tax=Microthlaspi erraticum TaxID=1685480 RepID=A0A6D2L0Z5_9BRAS|nr:unnamed protein product [Microthlaspi erraticum]